MIIDAIEAEKGGLWGRAYVDGSHEPGGGKGLAMPGCARLSMNPTRNIAGSIR